MKEILIIIGVAFFFSIGSHCQSADCQKIYDGSNFNTCILSQDSLINDTIIAYASEGCNFRVFQSIPDGICKVFASDSLTVLEITTIINGKINGKRISYYGNGAIKEIGNYKNNEYLGDFKLYDENGNILMEGSFKINRNRKHIFTGTISKYWDNGTRAYNCKTKRGSVKKEHYWDFDGNSIDYSNFLGLWFRCN